MKKISVGSVARFALLLALPNAAWAQTPQQSASLTIAGASDHAPVVQMNGKSYVDIESLARLVHASISFQGKQIVLTLPGAANAPAVQPEKTPRPPGLSQNFSLAAVEELTGIREWRVAIMNAVQSSSPVTDAWVGPLSRTAQSKLELASAAASTEPDHNTVELLKNEYNNMRQMSDQFVAMHASANYIPPTSFDNNPLDQKILSCARGIASMAASKQFQDEPACH